MKTFLFPGSFDPFSLGHQDIAKRAVILCDRLVVAVLNNHAKSPVFTAEERVSMAQQCLSGFAGIEVISFDGLLVDLYRKIGAVAVVRGLRGESDFRIEAEMAAANKLLLPEYDVILLPCSAEMVFISSSTIKEVAFYGGDISKMVDPLIVDFVRDRVLERKA
ncbi:MAG: pantetheine-phosphate adenylyltransferase [Clostridiales bacterium]|nr:pantetheine-phosphate adenylyltransferase [Clostridiales bacterium]